MAPKCPPLVRAMAVVSVIYGLFGLAVIGITLLWTERDNPAALDEVLFFAVLPQAVLLVSAFGLLALQPWARWAAMAYCVYMLGWLAWTVSTHGISDPADARFKAMVALHAVVLWLVLLLPSTAAAFAGKVPDAPPEQVKSKGDRVTGE
jgi:hypothetical protein